MKCRTCKGVGGGKASDGIGGFIDEMCPDCEGSGKAYWRMCLEYLKYDYWYPLTDWIRARFKSNIYSVPNPKIDYICNCSGCVAMRQDGVLDSRNKKT